MSKDNTINITEAATITCVTDEELFQQFLDAPRELKVSRRKYQSARDFIENEMPMSFEHYLLDDIPGHLADVLAETDGTDLKMIAEQFIEAGKALTRLSEAFCRYKEDVASQDETELEVSIPNSLKPLLNDVLSGQNFCERLSWWHHLNAEEPGAARATVNLIQACGEVWNNTKQVPEPFWHEVRDAIGNWKDADEWEKTGRKYSVAARLISARLKTLAK